MYQNYPNTYQNYPNYYSSNYYPSNNQNRGFVVPFLLGTLTAPLFYGPYNQPFYPPRPYYYPYRPPYYF